MSASNGNDQRYSLNNNGATPLAADASTAQWFAEGQKHHQAQRFAEAETLYRRIVQTDAGHAGAWHHLGMVCLAQNKLAEAEDGFRCVLAMSPANVDALTQMGIVLARQNKLDEAVARFRQALELRPEHAKAHNNLGVALTQMGKREEGLACYQEAAKLQPDYAEAHFNLAVAYADRRHFDDAIGSYQRALRVRPDYSDALFNLGLLLVSEGRSEEGVVCLEQAVRIMPENPEAHNNLSLALADVGRFKASIAASDAALRFRPLDAKSHMNRANSLSSLGLVDAALASYEFALHLQPDYVNAHWNRSLAYLSQGDYQRGWAEYEWRWKKPETKSPTFAQARWDGSPLVDKTILLWCEQGLGDTLQFVRFAFLLKQQGATVWLLCPEKLMPLLSSCRSIDRIFAEGQPPPSEFDCHAPLMSLPLLCQITLSNIFAATPYLFSDAAQVERWRKELPASGRLKVGVAWQGNAKHRWDRHRSFHVHWFQALAALDGVELFSLQKGPGAEQLSTIRFPITDLGSRLDETGGAFRETAAVMQSLALVITCDSSLAHLAGALGVPVWVAVSDLADWRWLRDREETPWYPTMRLFRQSELGDWRPVFERMRSELIDLRDSAARPLCVEIAPGELLDKLTILQIKSERISDADKLRNVRAELAVVEATRRQNLRDAPGLAELVRELKQVNERLWDIENRIRDFEKNEDFGSEFIVLARSVYQTNDRRAAIKRQLNELLGANFREEKEYPG